MKGDFSRNTFSPKKNYHAVLMQQGRVLLDADWNEMVDIANHRHSLTMRNLVGEHGGLGTGFKVTFVDETPIFNPGAGADKDKSIPDLYLNPGQYYAGGFSCGLDEPILFEYQPYFPGAADHKKDVLADADVHLWLLYLEVWERHLTVIEDPELAEPALGGADTTTRTQMVWQVKMLPIENPPENQPSVSELPEWQRLTRTRKFPVRMNQGYASENELFRIEIHAGNEAGEGEDNPYASSQELRPATWKWSRDNGTIAFPLLGIRQVENSQGIKDNHSLELSLAVDQRMQEQLRKGDCVELDCDDWVLDGRSGWLGCITQVEAPDEDGRQRLMITVSNPVTKSEGLGPLRDADKHPLVRRWDQQPNRGENEEGGFSLLQVDSTRPIDRSNLEITIPTGQPPLYPGDWLDLSGIMEEGIWLLGQVRAVASDGEFKKIQLALAKPLPDDLPLEPFPQEILVRRWEDEALPVRPNENLALEHGITVQFPPGKYRTGDYWLIPIRSGVDAGREFTVSQVDAGHVYTPLAVLTRGGAQWELTDLRRIFLDLGDVFTRLEWLQAELAKTNAKLAALQVETDIEDEEQEEEISALQKEITDVNERVDQLPVMSIQQSLGRYRSHEELEVGDVVASSLSRDDYVIKASRRASPIGVVAPRPDDFDEDEYSVVLSGPVVCRVRGRVKAGDLLSAARRPGWLEKASLWVRWFESDRIVARAIDNPTDPNDQFINVYFMPDLTNEED